MHHCKVGDYVLFGKPDGVQRRGRVIKLNRKSVKVMQTQDCRTYPAGTEWRVTPSLCRVVEGDLIRGVGAAKSPRSLAPVAPPVPRFAKGERVYFMYKNKAIQGFVKRVNTRTVSIETTKGSENWWRVPHHSVRRGEYNV